MNMKYCARCKIISFSEEEKCECGKHFAKKYDLDAPVVLIRANGGERGAVEKLLIGADIPYSVSEDPAYSPSIGRISSAAAYLVPLGFLKKGIDALSEGGIMTRPEWYDKLDMPDHYEWHEMPAGKRTVVRIASLLIFAILIWLCVAGVDIIAQLFVKIIS